MAAEENLNAGRPVQVGAHSPESGVSDEAVAKNGPAVRAIAAEFMARYKGTSEPDEFALAAAEAGLLAALPHLQPQPDMCHNGHPFEPGVDTDMDWEQRQPDARWCNVCGEARLQPQPVASRERVAEVLEEAFNASGRAMTWAAMADALLAAGVFREPPTREQIEQALQECGIGSYRTIVADALLDLLGGTGVDSTVNTCPGCGVNVIGHERCGDPTRPGCAS